MAGKDDGLGAEAMKRLVARQRRGEELAERWWEVVGELQSAEARLARLKATKERQITELLGGMTPRQRTHVQNHPSLSWHAAQGSSWRRAARHRQVWVHRQAQLNRLEQEWAPRLAAATTQVGDARGALATLAREALAMWEVHPESYVGRSRRQLQHLARDDS